MPPPEICWMELESYDKLFRILYWTCIKKVDGKDQRNKLLKKDKGRRIKLLSHVNICDAPMVLPNASQFAVFAAVRRTVLTRWRHLNALTDICDQQAIHDSSPIAPYAKVSKITGMGLKVVFSILTFSKVSDMYCECALKALLDIMQGHNPADLYYEPPELVSHLQGILVDISKPRVSGGVIGASTKLTTLSSTCLISLAVARGEAELVLSAVASLVMSDLSEEYVQIPLNLITLQRSVQSVIIGAQCNNLWLQHGVAHQSLLSRFTIDFPTFTTPGELIVRSLASDGCFLYLLTSKGLLKIGSGYGSSIKQHVYDFKNNFYCTDRHGWLGYCKDKLYVRVGRKKNEVYEVNKSTFETTNFIRLDPGPEMPSDAKTAVFTDGNQLGLVFLSNYHILCIKMYDVTSAADKPVLTATKELNVQLLRRRTLALGQTPFEDCGNSPIELDAPFALRLEDNDEDPIVHLAYGQDFALLLTESGKVYYNGKGPSLGYKPRTPGYGRWTIMKEANYVKTETHMLQCKVIQVAVGHDGLHAVLVLDNGKTLFTGLSRRGEDGDMTRYRRPLKPCRPKIMTKTEDYHVVYAACNNGSSALVTDKGILIMLGKDILHSDPFGVVTGLKDEFVTRVALGKAHAVALTSSGHVYTFGINNKGQCGRDFTYVKEKSMTKKQAPKEVLPGPRLCLPTHHIWSQDTSSICTVCNQCNEKGSACIRYNKPNRKPRDVCGCSNGDSGCVVCGACRRCVEVQINDLANKLDEEQASSSSRPDDKDGDKSDNRCNVMEVEKDLGIKGSCLAPARIAVPGGHKIIAVACGLHHTVLLTEHGDVMTFGLNQYGQLGTGDITAHHRIVRVRVPRASSIAAGSNHTIILTREGEIYTFGNYQKGGLGRPRQEGNTVGRHDRAAIWYATPTRVTNLGPRHASKGLWIAASGDQTFVQVSQLLVKTDTLFSSTITANTNTIVMLPNRPEHNFKCLTINKFDGSCNSWTGPEQVDFVNTVTCLDPLYDVLWCFQPHTRIMKCYNVLAYNSHKIQKCCDAGPDMANLSIDSDSDYPNYGTMKKLEDFRSVPTIEGVLSNDNKKCENVAFSNMSILNQELAIPSVAHSQITRMHAALHLLGCLDSLVYAHDVKLNSQACTKDLIEASIKEEYFSVNRFEGNGGGWGYIGHTVEAIRFMADTDIVLAGYGLFGGRGEYTARIKLYDIGFNGGQVECAGELIAETEEIAFECAPKDNYPILFRTPIPLLANKWYVAWASLNGPPSDCGNLGQSMIIDDEILFSFKTSMKSNNGTDVSSGQIPCILYHVMPYDYKSAKNLDFIEPVIHLTKNISRKVTISCFRSLITLLEWSWDTHVAMIFRTNGLIPIEYEKLSIMKRQKRLVYIIKSCLRLVRSYTNEIIPQWTSNKKASSYYDVMTDVRKVIQEILSHPIPTCAQVNKYQGKRKSPKVCYVQFALELTNTIMKECHETLSSCFHAFFPSPVLKWEHLCSLLVNVKVGKVNATDTYELTSVCAALCNTRNLRDVIHYIIPPTQACIALRKPEAKILTPDSLGKSATVPRSSHSKAPPIPPRNKEPKNKNQDDSEALNNHVNWILLDIIPKLLDIIMVPIKQQMMTRPCGKPHDHGEIKQHQRLSKQCCKFLARLVAELAHGASTLKDDDDDNGSNKYLVTMSRFLSTNHTKAWNSSNGSPDAICFTVDRNGISLAGVGIYGGLGTFEYELELLQYVRKTHAPADDTNMTLCWVRLEVTHGVFTATDCHENVVHLKFDRPVLLKDDVRYAIKISIRGGRTANGDSGLQTIRGPDGTVFRFSSSSLSFNGTTLARGQIPFLLYYGVSKSSSENSDTMQSTMRGITLRVSSTIMERCANLFCSLRNELTTEDLKRNAAVLHNSPAINMLIPYTLANLDTLKDTKTAVQLLDIIYKLMPHVTAMNLLVPIPDDIIDRGPPVTNGMYYTWVESDHPYKHSTVSNIRVLFPPNISWMVLEMDPRSITSQPEDSLTIYTVAGSPKQRCNCAAGARNIRPQFQERLVQLSSDAPEVTGSDIEDVSEDAASLHYNCTYVAITQKLSNIATDWPQRSIVVPGNEVIFSLETASDYISEYNRRRVRDEDRYGYRCLCIGYEDVPLSSKRQGLHALEMELAHAGASCAARLLAPDIEIPQLTPRIVAEVQYAELGVTSPLHPSPDSPEGILLARGLELTKLPTVHHVLDGLPLARATSTDRQFLADFVAGEASTAGGRLARWLSPAPRIEPLKSEIKKPTIMPRIGVKLKIAVIVRDQYEDEVTSDAVKVEVYVQKLDRNSPRAPRPPSENMMDIPEVPTIRYEPTLRDAARYQTITMMPVQLKLIDFSCFCGNAKPASALLLKITDIYVWQKVDIVTGVSGYTAVKVYSKYCLEELRFASRCWGKTASARHPINSPRISIEKLILQVYNGEYSAMWTPCAPGFYAMRCTIDDHNIAQDLVLEVAEAFYDGSAASRSNQAGKSGNPDHPDMLRRFTTKYTSGLRIRASPSLQSEELGYVPKGASLTYTEELVNKDGTWLRLTAESLTAYTEAGVSVAWCLQYHRHLNKVLLTPIENTTKDKNSVPSCSSVDKKTSDADASKSRQKFTVDPEEDDPSKQVRQYPSVKVFRLRDGEVIRTRNTQNRCNGNGFFDQWWAPRAQEIQAQDALRLEAEALGRSNLAQAGTQTSPDCSDKDEASPGTTPKGSSSSEAKDRYGKTLKESGDGTPPPVPTRPAPPPPLKNATSPAQAEAIRAIFAAVLWHEGIVHDAIACAAFLKFHSDLPKEGAKVVTRSNSREMPTNRPQRHSVEVSSSGQYLVIQPSMLESLKRAGLKANSSRARRNRSPPIVEEEAHCSRSEPSVKTTNTVNVLPPVFRALVSLYDSLENIDELAMLTNKTTENIEGDDDTFCRRYINGKLVLQSAYAVHCELCGHSDGNPVVSHIRTAHPGCKIPTLCGYDKYGKYKKGEAADFTSSHCTTCGGFGQEDTNGFWYMYCPDCRYNALKRFAKRLEAKALNEFDKNAFDHRTIKDNAMFLLDLTPLTQSVPLADSVSAECQNRNEYSPRTSIWQPAPPLQCLGALGKVIPDVPEGPRYHSLRKPHKQFNVSVDVHNDSEDEESMEVEEPRTKRRYPQRDRKPKQFPDYVVYTDEADVSVDVHNDTEEEESMEVEEPRTKRRYPQRDRKPKQFPDYVVYTDEADVSVDVHNDTEEEESMEVEEPRTKRRYPLRDRKPKQFPDYVVYTDEASTEQSNDLEKPGFKRLFRSISMGQGEKIDLVTAANNSSNQMDVGQDEADILSGVGSSLLTQPSAALYNLIEKGKYISEEDCIVNAFECPKVDPKFLMKRTVLTFVTARRDLQSYTHMLDATVRINTIREYALGALNWLLRSATQPICLHDIMWWFCVALDEYANLIPSILASLESNPISGMRIPTAIATTASICPGGRAGRQTRAALHTFLSSVSSLTPNLPPTSAAALQAVRCWAIDYSSQDKMYLHRYQMFTVISKILTYVQGEEPGMSRSRDSYHSNSNKDSFIWSCPDVTNCCDIATSSRQGSARALTDGNTETFWETAEDDRHNSKWIQITYLGGAQEERPHIICLHIDNTRDTLNKVTSVSFLYSGGSSEMCHMRDIEVDSNAASWVYYTLPRVTSIPIRVRCELRGPEGVVRVRQVRVLGAPAQTPMGLSSNPSHTLHALVETETLRVFRLVTSQVFGKLLNWDNNRDNGDGAHTSTELDANESDLTEHVVCILFTGHKLTSLQRQVMAHLVPAVEAEAVRSQNEWMAHLQCVETAEIEIGPDALEHIKQPFQDNYCFELLSLFLALSGSPVGLEHLSKRTELFPSLLTLLHTASERVQRQIISLLRRLIIEVSPQKMYASLNYRNVGSRITLIDHLMSYLAKAINIQVKVIGSGNSAASLVRMGTSVATNEQSLWFHQGKTIKIHADMVAKLLSDMLEGKLGETWEHETQSALMTYTSNLAFSNESDRHPSRCITSPSFWLTLATLCVCDEAHLERINAARNDVRDKEGSDHSQNKSRRICTNHDDGKTYALFDCKKCGALCLECDRFLHLNRNKKNHERQICKEEASAIRINIQEGCGRAKLFWLLLLVDRRTLKGLAEFRAIVSSLPDLPENAGESSGSKVAKVSGVCRFCGTSDGTGILVIGNVCADPQCQEHAKNCCVKQKSCGHPCYGVVDEEECLPCLLCDLKSPNKQLHHDADDVCIICFVDRLQTAPSIQLQCGHMFHLHCTKTILSKKWNGPRITFSFCLCPICKMEINHWALEELLAPLRRLRDEVRRKALMRLEFEGSVVSASQAGTSQDPATYAMEKYAYYVCHKCGKAYFGGLVQCEADLNGTWEPSELVCGACSDVTGARICPKHGADFLEYKCRYCCSVAVFFCFGASHFCNSCHDDFQTVTNCPINELPHCPAGPKGKQLSGTPEECPLRIAHPPTGEEFALGCGVCRNAHSF